MAYLHLWCWNKLYPEVSEYASVKLVLTGWFYHINCLWEWRLWLRGSEHPGILNPENLVSWKSWDTIFKGRQLQHQMTYASCLDLILIDLNVHLLFMWYPIRTTVTAVQWMWQLFSNERAHLSLQLDIKSHTKYISCPSPRNQVISYFYIQ